MPGFICIHTNTTATASTVGRRVVSSTVQLRHLVRAVENEGGILQFLCQVLKFLQLGKKPVFKHRDRQKSTVSTSKVRTREKEGKKIKHTSTQAERN